MKQSHVPSTGAGKPAESKLMRTARAVGMAAALAGAVLATPGCGGSGGGGSNNTNQPPVEPPVVPPGLSDANVQAVYPQSNARIEAPNAGATVVLGEATFNNTGGKPAIVDRFAVCAEDMTLPLGANGTAVYEPFSEIAAYDGDTDALIVAGSLMNAGGDKYVFVPGYEDVQSDGVHRLSSLTVANGATKRIVIKGKVNPAAVTGKCVSLRFEPVSMTGDWSTVSIVAYGETAPTGGATGMAYSMLSAAQLGLGAGKMEQVLFTNSYPTVEEVDDDPALTPASTSVASASAGSVVVKTRTFKITAHGANGLVVRGIPLDTAAGGANPGSVTDVNLIDVTGGGSTVLWPSYGSIAADVTQLTMVPDITLAPGETKTFTTQVTLNLSSQAGAVVSCGPTAGADDAAPTRYPFVSGQKSWQWCDVPADAGLTPQTNGSVWHNGWKVSGSAPSAPRTVTITVNYGG